MRWQASLAIVLALYVPSATTTSTEDVMSNRTDSQGYSTKVTALGHGFGCRVFKDGALVSEGHAKTKADIGPVLRDLLRWVDKAGGVSEMASASRDRNALRR
jgi:hypothetical protein